MVDVVDVPDLDTMLHAAAAGSVVDRGSAVHWPGSGKRAISPTTNAPPCEWASFASPKESPNSSAPHVPTSPRMTRGAACVGTDVDLRQRRDQKVTLSRRRFETLLVRLASAAAHVELGATTPGSAGPATHDDFANQFVTATGRERLLAEAIRRFDERGSGRSATSRSAWRRGCRVRVSTSIFRARRICWPRRCSGPTNGAPPPPRRHWPGPGPRTNDSTGCSTGYVDFALQHSHLLGVYVSELDQLPDRERRAAQQAQRDHIALWCEVLEQVRPGLDRDEARIVVAAALCTIDDMVRTGHAGRRPDLAERLTEVCRAVLLAEDVEP